MSDTMKDNKGRNALRDDIVVDDEGEEYNQYDGYNLYKV